MDSRGTPILYNYLKKYQENPRSRIFAPLAEAYRKAGLIEEAIEIAKEGLAVHPNFVGGKVALARAYFDKKQYKDVISLLSTVVSEVPDNLVAQRLLAESGLMLGHIKIALESYKMILYYHPHDQETTRLVWELESQVYNKSESIVKPSNNEIDSPVIDPLKRQRAIEVLRRLLSAVQQS